VDEKELIKQCLDGNRSAQQQLYKMYASKMLGVCYRYAHSMDEAKDFFQDAFIKVFRNLDRFKGEGSLEGWIRRIMVNTSLNHLKASHKFIETLNEYDYADQPEWQADSQTDAKEIMEEIRLLPTGFRTVFNMYAVEGYSHKEIAEALGISEGTSRSQYARARAHLMKKLTGKSITGEKKS
jgi:RNA polymerase sigma factor (sigma-70 family)